MRGGVVRANPRVLLVEGDPAERDILSSWLEQNGYDVTACPGPTAPTYVCVGDRTGACPLVEEADLVVLDCRLESDPIMEGTSAGDLLSLYLCAGQPVVALGLNGLSSLFEGEDVIFLENEPKDGLLSAVDRLLIAS
jgi:CheY-like chemotaxis protein